MISTYDPVATPSIGEFQERLTWVGADDRGVELEVVAVVEPDYLLVIHVMPILYRRRR